MTRLYTRRDVLKTTGAAAGLSLFSILSSGCGNGGGASDGGGSSDSGQSTSITLPYSDTDQFMDQVERYLELGMVVKVTFSNDNKLSRTSKLVEMIKNQSVIQNYDAFVETLRRKDTTEGRAELSLIFDSELLEHEQLSEPVKLPSGEVIEPGTIALVVVVLFALAAGAEILRGRRLRKLELGRGLIEFEPV